MIAPKADPARGLTILLLVSGIACVGALAFVAVLYAKPNEQIPFSATGWNAPLSDSKGYTGTRLKMVDDLLRRYDLHGWSVWDVQGLLGKPSEERVEHDKRLMVYDLRDGLNLLTLEIDDQQRVTEYHVFRED